MSRDPAPGRPSGRSGALLWRQSRGPLGLSASIAILAATALIGLGGCDAIGGGSTLTLDSAEVSIDGSVHEVRVAGAGALDSIAPARVEAEPGDAIRFVTGDARPHALTFSADALAAPVREYLDRTGQLRGPPLVNEGSAWIVVLEGAPPGRYPFHCRSHDAAGELIVRAGD